MDQRTEKVLIFFLFLVLLQSSGNGAYGFEPFHVRNRNYPRQPAFKLPYKPKWVSRVKKGGVFKYKRREFSSPVVYEDRIFVGTESGYFYAMKKKNGRRVWRFKTEGSVSSRPGIRNGKVFFGDDEGYFYALDLQTGEKIWSLNLDAEILTAPALKGDQLFLVTVEGRVVALTEREGTILWERQHSTRPLQMTIRGNSTPVLDPEGNLYVGFADGTFWSLSSKTGKILWERRIESGERFHDLDGVPLIEGDRIYISSFDGPLTAVTKSGRILWSVSVGSAVPFLSEKDLLYVSDSQGSLLALQKKDGSTLWKTKVGEGALTAPLLHNDVIAVGLSSSTMNFVDRTTGRLMFRRFAKKGISSDPFLDGDQLCYLSNGGRLYSLKMVDKSVP
ncbi:MAG: PQQ-binding-like beta-propeller repeat protein [Deltaproteobacteria bacterium]|nr:PQQ-binding-like beta-propeller repeat protein [Deltaproteobacteria bacterium]